MKFERHHIVPLSLFGEDKKENILCLKASDHQELHNNQNIDSSIIRTFRKRVNHILIPNDYVLNLKKDLWHSYFIGAKTYIKEQKNSLYKQGEILRKPLRIQKEDKENLSLYDSIEYLIEMQKAYINNILKNGTNL